MRWRVLLLVSAAVLSACGERAPAGDPGQLRPEDLTAVERRAFVYAAAIRHLVEAEGGNPERIYVLDQDSTGAPIPQEVQDRVREELALLGRVTFVPEDHEAARAAAQGRTVEDVVISLGTVPAGRDRVEVEASSYSGASEETRTLVLRRYGLRWRVDETS
jgi:uncharacterized phage protein gp47/JayE